MNHYPDDIPLLFRMMRGRDKIKNNTQKDRIEQPYVHFCALHTAPQWNLLLFSVEERKKSNRSDPDLVNDPITTLLFGGVQKYYDGSVAIYSYFVCNSAIPKFPFDPKNTEERIFFVLFQT